MILIVSKIDGTMRLMDKLIMQQLAFLPHNMHGHLFAFALSHRCTFFRPRNKTGTSETFSASLRRPFNDELLMQQSSYGKPWVGDAPF